MTVRELSAFEMEKAARLLREKLPCLGCHELDGEGGRIGPSLSRLAVTRSPDYVFAMISDPQGTVPGTVMPRVPMMRKYVTRPARYGYQLRVGGEPPLQRESDVVEETTLELIANYLLQREPSSGRVPAQLPRPAPSPPDSTADGATLYGHYCASCHGEEGAGDGPNAEYLPVTPVSHADATYMSGRPDDSLFDAIYSGGYIMNRSQLMPAYGWTLSREQIWRIVRHLRALCDCRGPDWSRDNR
ncbi:MAG: c-type cytochrome [Gemmatimonadetes bacterium]|nr:c-type cytochrome [Gemmatimonadota bacterium]NIS01718.1 c-type cytochrome [Gemmatimonadota bacterium]NIT67500.1 c-type cytochrome [Gemmatimonadota bacterium]NIU53363.1 c-type cytochrome [Gemmatimonadota bacterium]NIV24201.1 c-type cytochrome [Gemmatimonadota bacterium]